MFEYTCGVEYMQICNWDINNLANVLLDVYFVLMGCKQELWVYNDLASIGLEGKVNEEEPEGLLELLETVTLHRCLAQMCLEGFHIIWKLARGRGNHWGVLHSWKKFGVDRQTMKYLKFTRKIAVPEGVKVEIKSRVVTVTGERGTLQKDFRHIQIDLKLQSKGRKVVAELWHCDRKTAACLRSITAAIQNMITGVTKGFRYKMRLVYAHFPINVNIEEDGTLLEIRNFLGEKIVRAVKLGEGVTIERSSDVKDELVLSGNDINNVSQSAARIQQSCLVKNKDIRKYLDGIYVSEKGHVVQED
jgi:large subunit ribosomal protein L9e